MSTTVHNQLLCMFGNTGSIGGTTGVVARMTARNPINAERFGTLPKRQRRYPMQTVDRTDRAPLIQPIDRHRKVTRDDAALY